jgi:hypothetical protein
MFAEQFQAQNKFITIPAQVEAPKSPPKNKTVFSFFSEKTEDLSIASKIALQVTASNTNKNNTQKTNLSIETPTVSQNAKKQLKAINSTYVKCFNNSKKNDIGNIIKTATGGVTGLSLYQAALLKLIFDCTLTVPEKNELVSTPQDTVYILSLLPGLSYGRKNVLNNFFAIKLQDAPEYLVEEKINTCKTLTIEAASQQNLSTQTAFTDSRKEALHQHSQQILLNAAELATTISDSETRKHTLAPILLNMTDETRKTFISNGKGVDPKSNFKVLPSEERETLVANNNDILKDNLNKLQKTDEKLKKTILEAFGCLGTVNVKDVTARLSNYLLESNSGAYFDALTHLPRNLIQDHLKKIAASETSINKFLNSLPKEMDSSSKKLEFIQMLEKEGLKTTELGAGVEVTNPEKSIPYEAARHTELANKSPFQIMIKNNPNQRTKEEEAEFNDMRTEQEENQTKLTRQERAFCWILAKKMATKAHLNQEDLEKYEAVDNSINEINLINLLKNDFANVNLKGISLNAAKTIAEKSKGLPEKELGILLADLENSGDAKQRQLALAIYRSHLKKGSMVKSLNVLGTPISHTDFTPQQKLALRNLGYRAWNERTPFIGESFGNLAAAFDRTVGITNAGIVVVFAAGFGADLMWNEGYLCNAVSTFALGTIGKLGLLLGTVNKQ